MLYKNWRKAALSDDATDEQVREYAEKERQRVSTLRDPFTPIANMNEAERAAAGERVLWEDDTIMVLVDRFHDVKPLVIPKKQMMFPIDAPPGFMDRLAVVAAATSDALIWGAGGECETASSSRIYVNPPKVIGIRQLHAHVQPSHSIRDSVQDGFYTRVSEYLADALEWTHAIQREAEYYRNGPQQAQPPDGTFAAGTKVMLLEDRGSYSLVLSEGNVKAYVARASLVKIPE